MPRRKPKKAAPGRKRPESTAELRKALARRTKAELVGVLLELAQADRGVLRQLTARFNVAAAPDELVAATHQAIADATDFDEREINHNFDYDYEAYGEVKRNLDRLIGAGQLRLAMQLALDLMNQGSYQVEMSDEGMMTEDIEDCLSVVNKAMQKGDLPVDERRAWSTAWASSPGSNWNRSATADRAPRPVVPFTCPAKKKTRLANSTGECIFHGNFDRWPSVHISKLKGFLNRSS